MSLSINDYMTKMQQIDEIARKTISMQQKRLPEKYSNIQATLKLLNNLISSFKRKADSYEQQLKARAKIDDLFHQIQFHQDRVSQCQKLSQQISNKISEKRKKIQEDQLKIITLKKQIISLKTQNVKKIIRLQELQKIQDRMHQKEDQQNRKNTWKIKTQYNRQFYKGIDMANIKLKQSSILCREKQKLTAQISKRLQKKTALSKLINQAFIYMKGKLCERQRKANMNGMNGSLLFKMIQNQNQKRSLKPLNDKKLIIYDVLKSRHKQHIRKQKAATQTSSITLQQFMQFNSLQVMGIIQLQGGYTKLQQLITNYEQQKLAKQIQQQQMI